MKKIIPIFVLIFTNLVCYFPASAQTIARYVISTAGGTLSGGGYSINYNIGETMITSLSAGSNMITQGFEQPDDALLNSIIASLNLKAFLEGFYEDVNSMRATIFDLGISTDPTETDTVLVNLWSPENLQQPVYSLPAVLHTNGTASVQFPAAIRGHSYYIAVKHRNHIETWSHDPVTFIATTGYDFSTALNQAYDDGNMAPMKNVGETVYAFYAGDINQDGGIDGQDMNVIDNEVGFFGYNVSDVNGDGGTDGQDMNFVDNNSQLGLFFARPY